jgi:AcrR family transcriptional regulator
MPSQTFYNLPDDKKNRIIEAITDELGLHTYEHINIQNIIKQAKIPRGSFYQYFEDKDDMFDFFLSHIKNLKFQFWGPLFSLETDIPFIERFRQIYIKGIAFEKAYPKLVKVAKNVVNSDALKQRPIYQEGLKQAQMMFESYIIKDQENGLIREDIDPKLLSTILNELMNKITLEELSKTTANLNTVEQRASELIEIIMKGICIHV